MKMNGFLSFTFVQISAVLQAGRCVPPLMEGDQVLLINGRDISEHTHQQVVMFIKASRESHSKELALLVRRKGMNVCLNVLAKQMRFEGD